MPKVSVTRIWPDGDRIQVSATEDSGHPDGLLEEVARIAVKTYADTLGVTYAFDTADEAEETP
jgi:hypothetical protein